MTKFRLFFLTSLLAGFSLTFTACDKDDDDDDDKNGEEQVDNKDNKEKEEQGINASSQIVGKWRARLNQYEEKCYINGFDMGEGEDDPDDPMTEDDLLFGGNPTFNSDGTCTLSSGETGTYELWADNQFSLTYTENGETITLKKGLDAKMFAMDVAESMGVDAEYAVVKSSEIENFQVVVEDYVMHVKMTSTAVMDWSKMQNMPGGSIMIAVFKSMGITDLSNVTIKLVTDEVYTSQQVPLY